MKYKLKILFVFFSIVFFSLIAQENSNVIQNINGKNYYVHEVKKGESLYGISKLYGIDIETLLLENPSIKESGLKAGYHVLIPVKESRPQAALDTVHYMYHRVLRKQTVYSICKEYGLNQEKFYEWNPEAKNGLKENDWVIVGKKNTQPQTPNNNVQEIKSAIDSKIEVIKKHYERKKEYTVLMLLPFGANKAEELLAEDMVKTGQSFPSMGAMMIDFLKGFEYVKDSLVADSFRINLFPLDVNENDSLKIKQMVGLSEYEAADVIVGPVFSSLIKADLLAGKEKKFHIVPFVGYNKFLFNCPEYSKTTPSVFVDIQTLARYIYDSLRPMGKVVLLAVNNNGEKEYSKEFKRYYNELILKNGMKDTVRTFRNVADFKKTVKEGEKYVVVVLTNNQVIATDYITQLSIICKSSPIVLCGFYKTLYFDNLDLEYLNQMQFTFAYYQNITSTHLYSNYLRKYKEEFNSDPSLFFYEGVEIAQYYFNVIKNYGLSGLYELNNYKQEDKKNFMKFQFYRPDESTGFQNNGEFVFRIQDRKIQVIK